MKQLRPAILPSNWATECDICPAMMIAPTLQDLEAAIERKGWGYRRCPQHTTTEAATIDAHTWTPDR